jgi:serine/threonine protein kinase/dipeptidyl aminopeptidase/acylaminoacyl peptidase
VSEIAPRLTAALADRYRIERELGQGGMATVYLAEDLKHKRKVALKVLKPELAAVLGAERFVQEITTTASLQHPHILPLFDSGTADGFLFYVMPFIEGETLRDKLNRETQLGVDEAVRIAREVADALDYAHGKGVIHRDIKPENILIQNGRPVVADFGIALAVSAAAGGRMTETGLSLGTPHYMSPEQATADKEISARSDVYSLASVLYEMLAGQPPHLGGSAQQIIMKIIAEPVASVTTLRKSVPPNVASALAKALEKLPADRFESAAQFAEALANPAFVLPGEGTSAGMARTIPGWKERAVVPLLAVATLSLVAAVWGWVRPPPSTPVARYHLATPDSAPLVSGSIARIALTPDGSRLIYRTRDGGLWVRERERLSATKLAGTEGAQAPFVSPDGATVGYLEFQTLWTVPLGGGPPVRITATLVGEDGASWSPNGFIYVDGNGPTALLKLHPTVGSTAEPFTRLDAGRGETDHVFPEALPNGNGVLFVIRIGGFETWEIAVADAKTGDHHVLVKGLYARYASSGHLLFVTASGTLMAARFDEGTMRLTGEPVALQERVGVRGVSKVPDLVVSRTGTVIYSTVRGQPSSLGEPVWVGRDGRAVPVAPGWTMVAGYPPISPDGGQLALSIQDNEGRNHIWVRNLVSGTVAKLSHRGAFNFRPAWSSDSKRVVFISDRTKQGELFISRADGTSEDSLLLTRNEQISEGLITTDGAWLVYRQGANANADLYARRMKGDTTPVALATTEYLERQPTVSPDGRYIAYNSNETGRTEIYVRPFPNVGDGKWVVSTSGGVDVRWSRNGRELSIGTETGISSLLK